MKQRFLLGLFFVFLFAPSLLLAQWQPNGATTGNIYYNSGNIAIGLTTPYQESRLHIKSPTPHLWGFVSEANTNRRIVALGHNGTAGYVSVSYLDQTAGYSPLKFNTSNLTRVTIATDGNIGIGTETPDKLLHVHGSNNPTIAIGKGNTNTAGKSSLIFSAGDGLVANAFTIQYNRVPNVDRLGFIGGGNVEHMSILNSGRVGIGTTIPDATLAVRGNIHATEVKVDLNVPGPDYVFEENYELRSLAEVQAYISKHKHLPEMPSAREMGEDGINIGEMNMLLLKKIEELTLYVIEQDKTIKKQTQEIELLKAKHYKE